AARTPGPRPVPASVHTFLARHTFHSPGTIRAARSVFTMVAATKGTTPTDHALSGPSNTASQAKPQAKISRWPRLIKTTLAPRVRPKPRSAAKPTPTAA